MEKKKNIYIYIYWKKDSHIKYLYFLYINFIEFFFFKWEKYFLMGIFFNEIGWGHELNKFEN